MVVKFFFQDVKISISQRNTLKSFIESIFITEKKGLSSLSYIFCSDGYLLDMNKCFLGHDYYTDIISFSLADYSKPVEGEIYISIDRVKENAKIIGVTIKEEIHRVIFHGALHLCGYEDKTVRAKKAMTKAENKYLWLYFD